MLLNVMVERHPSEPEKLHITPERKNIIFSQCFTKRVDSRHKCLSILGGIMGSRSPEDAILEKTSLPMLGPLSSFSQELLPLLPQLQHLPTIAIEYSPHPLRPL